MCIRVRFVICLVVESCGEVWLDKVWWRVDCKGFMWDWINLCWNILKVLVFVFDDVVLFSLLERVLRVISVFLVWIKEILRVVGL